MEVAIILSEVVAAEAVVEVSVVGPVAVPRVQVCIAVEVTVVSVVSVIKTSVCLGHAEEQNYR